MTVMIAMTMQHATISTAHTIVLVILAFQEMGLIAKVTIQWHRKIDSKVGPCHYKLFVFSYLENNIFQNILIMLNTNT